MGRKTASYGQLLDYITKDTAVVEDESGKPFLIKHNVKGTSLEGLEREFLQNEALAHPRKGRNKLFHEVLSWHEKDSLNLDANKIEILAREYVRLRNENALYVGAIHEDKTHKHLHLCISGTEAFSGKGIRISKEDFAEIKKHLQSFELEKFGLVNSTVQHGKGEQERKSEREYQAEARTGKILRKEEIRHLLEKTYGESISKDEFISKLHEQGLETYDRNGKTSGIDDSRHLRFSTLGFTEERFEVLDKRQEWLGDLEEMRGGKIEQEQQEPVNEEEVKAKELDDLRNMDRWE